MVTIRELDSSDIENSLDSSRTQTPENVFEQVQEMDSNFYPDASGDEGHRRMEEINAYDVPKEVSPKPDVEDEELQPKVSKHLKKVVLEAVMELKRQCQPPQTQTQQTDDVITDAVPISFRIPQENDPKHRSKATLVGEITRSFTLPAQLLAAHGDDLDKFPVPAALLEQLKPNSEYKKQYNFSERLENWKLMCKQRVNGKLDIYYEHGKSEEFFRSMVEVVNFIMYEICPRHLVKIARGTPGAEPSGTEGKKRKRFSARMSNEDHEEEMKTALSHEEEVKKFLKEAYENLQNLFSNENRGESSSTVNNKP